jgi:hypothetical protein
MAYENWYTLAYKISLSDLGSTDGQRGKASLALSEVGLAMVQGQSPGLGRTGQLGILPTDTFSGQFLIFGTCLCLHPYIALYSTGGDKFRVRRHFSKINDLFLPVLLFLTLLGYKLLMIFPCSIYNFSNIV